MPNDYYQKLKDPRWQKKRLEVFERDGFACSFCQNDETELQAHHLSYEFGKDPWDYPEEELMTLCKDCHRQISGGQKLAKKAIQSATDIDLPHLIHNLVLEVEYDPSPFDIELLRDLCHALSIGGDAAERACLDLRKSLDRIVWGRK